MISYGLQQKKMVRVYCSEGGAQQNSLYYDMFLISSNPLKKNKKKSNKTKQTKSKLKIQKETITVGKVRGRKGWL